MKQCSFYVSENKSVMPGHPENLKNFSKLHFSKFKMGECFNLQGYPKVTITYIKNPISKSNKKLSFFLSRHHAPYQSYKNPPYQENPVDIGLDTFPVFVFYSP